MKPRGLCLIPTHRGHRWYLNSQFGCDACEREVAK